MNPEEMRLPNPEAAEITRRKFMPQEWIVDPQELQRLLPDEKARVAAAHTLRYLARQAQLQSEILQAQVKMLEAKAALFGK